MFKEITGFENYLVSSTGEVKNRITGKVLKQQLTTHGYLTVQLYAVNPKVVKKVRVHRLVALAFLEPIEGKESINHIDGDKKNNQVGNLEWVNQQENDFHAKNLLKKQIRPSGGYSGQHHSRAKKFVVHTPEGETITTYGYSELEYLLKASRSYIHKKLLTSNVVKGFKIIEQVKESNEVENLTHHLVVRLTESEDAALRKLSELREKPKSNFLRIALKEILQKEGLL